MRFMEKKFFLSVFVLAAAAAMASGASAASIFDITFPIVELGGCADQTACKIYCDESANQQACTKFAVDHGFVSKENAIRREQIKQKIKDAGGGPGGCADENACRSYCQDPAHLDECVAFGEQHGLIDQKDVQQIKKSGLVSGPGGCQGADACRAFCDASVNQQMCVDWASQNGVITKDEAVQAKKIAGRAGPGGCSGDQCREYCADTSHADECLSFAEQNNLISSADAGRAKKFLQVSQQGGPGGCTGAQCRAYCEDAAHHDECLNFAKKNGLVTEDEAKQFEAGQKIQDTVRQSGGPGGCADDSTCKDYCTDPSHVEECVAFASAHGGVSTQQAQEMLKAFTEQKARGNGDFNSSQDIQQFQQESDQKFQQFKQLEQQFRGPDTHGFGGGFSGPQDQGGQNPNSNPDQNQGFGGGHGSGASQGRQQGNGTVRVGPGGCTSSAECIKYCSEHKDECFGQSSSDAHDQNKNNSGGPGDGGLSADSQGQGNAAGGIGQKGGFGSSPPQLRGGLIRQIREGAIPQNFLDLPAQERERIFRDQLQGGNGRQQGVPGQEGSSDHNGTGQSPQSQPGGQGGGFSPQENRNGQNQNNSFGSPSRGEKENMRGPMPQESRDASSGRAGSPERMNQPPSGVGSPVRPDGSSGQFPQGAGSFNQSEPNGFFAPRSPPSGGLPNQQFPNSGGFNQSPPGGGSINGSGGSFSPPPSGGSMPPSSGSPPPAGGGGSMPPPPSGFAPLSNFFAAALAGLR